jgi:hypothetical protein
LLAAQWWLQFFAQLSNAKYRIRHLRSLSFCVNAWRLFASLQPDSNSSDRNEPAVHCIVETRCSWICSKSSPNYFSSFSW